jgi:uncharacterized protein (DUF1501 family)
MVAMMVSTLLFPYQDSAYYSARPDLTYKPETLLPLSSDLALNASMTGIKSLWDANKVAIVRGVGYPKPDRSHFSSMSIWQTGSPAAHSEYRMAWTLA